MTARSDRLATLYLAARLEGPPAVTLLLDIRNPQRWLEVADLDQPTPAAESALIVAEGELPEAAAGPRSTLRFSTALLWMLLDPGRAGCQVVAAAEDDISRQQQLRGEARRLWERLAWWGHLAESLRQTCRSTLASFSAAAGQLVVALDQLSAEGVANPFGGWSDLGGEPPVSGAASPGSAPAESVAPDDPVPVPTGMEPEGIAAWLRDPAGLGKVLGAGFAPRGEQADMAAAVAFALADPHALLCEAGTGVGKTLAYLLPVLADLKSRSGRAVISTFTRTLQRQIMEHDLPLLAPLFPEVAAGWLMGRNNYLCRRQQLQFLSRPVTSWREACAVVGLRLWLAATEFGLREELASHPALRSHLQELFETPHPCSPGLCYEQEGCFVQKARRRAHAADLVVINHSLLMHDFLSGNSLLGPYRVLVVDEAHRLPQVALDTHAIRVDQPRLRELRELVEGTGVGAGRSRLGADLAARMLSREGAPAELRSCLQAWEDALAGCLRTCQVWWAATGRRFDERLGERERPQGRVRVYDEAESFGTVRAETQALLASAAATGATYARLNRALDGWRDQPPELEDVLGTLAQVGDLLARLERDIRFLTGPTPQDWVVWLEPDAASGLRAIGATRLEAGPLLRDYWRAQELQPILTSATLAVGRDFSFMQEELGLRRLHPAAAVCAVDSPFDYDRQTLFLAPADIPAPDQAEFVVTVASLLRGLWQSVRRRTLVLFTSYLQLQKVAQALAEDPATMELFATVPGAGVGRGEIIVQNSAADTAELLTRFRRRPASLLLGTTSFWEGVDFPGADLELLVVCKLPFAVPTDPWVEARCEKLQAGGENPFTNFMVRDAVLRLRQGVGRLIRSQSDRGVLVLLDNRLHGKSYGMTFRGALPAAVHVCRDVADVIQKSAAFFRQVDEEAAGRHPG